MSRSRCESGLHANNAKGIMGFSELKMSGSCMGAGSNKRDECEFGSELPPFHKDIVP
jgi:hypothetical protein